MLIGDGFQDGMVTAEQVELEKVGRRRLPAQPVRNRSTRAHKIKMTSSATVVKTYSKDDNGCSHDDPHQWNTRRGTHVIGKKNAGRSILSRTRWVLDWNTIALHARKKSGKGLFD